MQRKSSREIRVLATSLGLRCAHSGAPWGSDELPPTPQLLDRTWRAVCIVWLCVVCVTVPSPPRYVTVHVIGCVTLWLCVYNHGACRRLRVLEAGGDGGGGVDNSVGLGQGPQERMVGARVTSFAG